VLLFSWFPFYFISEHSSCHWRAHQMPAFCVIKLSCLGTPVSCVKEHTQLAKCSVYVSHSAVFCFTPFELLKKDCASQYLVRNYHWKGKTIVLRLDEKWNSICFTRETPLLHLLNISINHRCILPYHVHIIRHIKALP